MSGSHVLLAASNIMLRGGSSQFKHRQKVQENVSPLEPGGASVNALVDVCTCKLSLSADVCTRILILVTRVPFHERWGLCWTRVPHT